MSRKLMLVGILIAMFLILPSYCFSQTQEYKIGVLANLGKVRAASEWQATADFLSEKTGKTFSIVPLDYDEVSEWTKDKKIDFMLTNSAMYAELNKLHGLQAIATQLSQYNGRSMDHFGSVILVKNDSPIKTLDDLK